MRMSFGSRRALSNTERQALSPGLAAALAAAGVEPVIRARPSIPAILARLWRRRTPVMVLGRTIYWPGALDDFTATPYGMSLLQHELQHVLEFRTGVLTRLSYILQPRNWIYAYRLDGAQWCDLGAEQRAQMVQDYWLAERALLTDAPPLERFTRLIPWACDATPLYPGETGRMPRMPLLLCPNCNTSMQSVQRSGVELDMCPGCRGVWLDRGELEKILEAGRSDIAQETQAREAFHRDVDDFRRDPNAWQQRHPYDAQRQQYRYDDDKDHYRHGYRKKKRFDLFDIFD